MALVLLMGLSISAYNTFYLLFLIFYMLSKLVMFVMFIKVYFIERARNHAIYMIIENIVSVIAVILVQIISNHYYYAPWVWLLVYSVLFIYSWSHMVVFLYLRGIRDLGVNIP